MSRLRRRGLLRIGGLTLAGAIAGCTDGGDPTDGDDESPTGTPHTDTLPEGTTFTGTTEGAGQVPGADMVGGPDDLRDRVDVTATVLESDQGAGKYVYTPAVAWVATGGTVVWSFEGATHTVTVYHPDYDRPLRVPEGLETPFNSEFSGAGEPGSSFNFVFETPGVYNYFCKPHESLGMVGVVIVESPQDGPGTTDPSGDLPDAARSNLQRQLELAGIL